MGKDIAHTIFGCIQFTSPEGWAEYYIHAYVNDV